MQNKRSWIDLGVFAGAAAPASLVAKRQTFSAPQDLIGNNLANMRQKRAEVSEKLSVTKALRNEKICRMHNEGAPMRLIASTLGVSLGTVHGVLNAVGQAPNG